jgi:hypothetical protein
MVTIPVSVGELIDKYSILQVKKANVPLDKMENVHREMRALAGTVSKFLSIDAISVLYEDLIGINSQLWTVEDKLRVLEKEGTFDQNFITLARSVYHLNDERFSIKNKINILTDSDIKEVKHYIDYK